MEGQLSLEDIIQNIAFGHSLGTFERSRRLWEMCELWFKIPKRLLHGTIK